MLTSPASLRNRGPIAEVLSRVLPPAGLVLEIASGSGEHVEFFARAFPELVFQPTDIDPAALESIAERKRASRLANFLAPVALDVEQPAWPVDRAEAVLCSNMIHIAPFSACVGLVRGAARLLRAGAPLVLYGPFAERGAHNSPGNEAFDEDLKRRNPAWGVRDLVDVEREADLAGFELRDVVAMPANNRTVVFRRRPSA